MEYFVETEDTVQIKKSDLESWRTEDDGEPEDMPSVHDVAPKELMPTAVQPKLPAPLENGPPGQRGDGLQTREEAKLSLDKFLESLHKKASQATTWISALEPPAVAEPTAKQKQLLKLHHSF